MKPFKCFQCKKWFKEEDDSSIECCVGGHWTPHSSDSRPTGYAFSCCHQYQKEVNGENN